jgi:outer membrane protein TolC
MKRFTFFLLFLFVPGIIISQETLSLKECLTSIDKNHPLSGRKSLIEKQHRLNQSNIQANRYPQIQLNGQATYQSEVTEINVEIPPPVSIDFPSVNKDQYKITTDINQLIYSGGKVSLNQEAEALSKNQSLIDHKQEILRLKEQVAGLYFQALILKQRQHLLRNQKSILQSKQKQIQSAIKHGAALELNGAELKSEIIKLKQQIAEVKSGIQSVYSSLAFLTGLDLNNDSLATPDLEQDISPQLKDRTEYQQMEVLTDKMEVQKSLTKSNYYPSVYAFGQAGYGQPGLNMFSDEFSGFYIVGAKLSWTPFDWNSRKRNIEILKARQEEIKLRKQSLKKSFHSEINNIRQKINELQYKLDTDREIISLKAQIMKMKSTQLDNGTINSAEYIKAVKNFSNAQLKKNIHKIELQKSYFNLKLKSGQLK